MKSASSVKQLSYASVIKLIIVTPRHAYGGTEGRRRYSPNLFSTTLDEGGQHPGNDPLPTVQKDAWVSGSVWMVCRRPPPGFEPEESSP